MPKNIQDIVVTEKRKSIRDVPMPEGRRKTDIPARNTDAPASMDSMGPRVMPERAVPPRAPKKRAGRPIGNKKWIFTGAALIVLLFIVLSLFSGATLAYTPKSATLTFAGDTYTANKAAEGGLLFSVVKLSGDKGKSVPATGEEDVSVRASGSIIVYNKNADSQRLVENTRFETPDGKVYRIQSPITVPAQRTVSGVVQPGSVEAVVYADQPGESYNIELSDFTVPGLAGTARYTTVYARSKTPMSGGFIGKRPQVSAANLESAKVELQAELRNELGAQASAQVPADFILFPSLSTITYEELPQTAEGDSSAVVNMRGNFYAVMFKRSDLATFLASDKAALAPGEIVNIPAFETLDLTFNGDAPADLLNSTQINFVVNGATQLLWRTNEDALKEDLVGVRKSDVSSILSNYPSIRDAEAVVRPFWKSAFPDEAEDINIKRLTTE